MNETTKNEKIEAKMSCTSTGGWLIKTDLPIAGRGIKKALGHSYWTHQVTDKAYEQIRKQYAVLES